jgi:hypothetical protein
MCKADGMHYRIEHLQQCEVAASVARSSNILLIAQLPCELATC